MMVFFVKDKMVYKSDTLTKGDIIGKIPPDAINNINILQDVAAIQKYGGMANNGVIEIHLKDGKYPYLYKTAKIDSAEKKSK